jgi:replicative DNA helicase
LSYPDLTLDIGLPANVDAERIVIAAVLIDNAYFTEASEKLDAEDFSLDSNRRIWLRISELMGKQKAVDEITLAAELRRHKELDGVGGSSYIAGLSEGMPRRPAIGDYVAELKDKGLLRKLMGISSMAIARAADQSDSAQDVLGFAMEQMQAASEQGISSPLQSFGTFVEKAYPSVDAVFKHSARSQGLPSGLKELDALTCGFQRKELIVIAARPAMGKTAAGLALCVHASINLDQTSALFSMEMRKEAILHRLVSMRSTVTLNDIREGRWTDTNKRYALDAMSDIVSAPLYIDDQAGQSIQKIRAKAARLKSQTGHLDLIVIDQLNYIALPVDSKKYGNRSQDLGFITRGLKGMAVELDVPVVVLHQLSRANEKRDDREPRLSDLRDSGEIEQDADVVIFPHRPSYYDAKADDKEKLKAVMILAKQRQGPTGRAECEYLAENTLFRNVEPKASLCA